jgi:1-acyl-sn-glycerol-3-phosphate acyltransferase
MNGHAHTRNLASPVLNRFFRIRLLGAHHLPRRGGVLVVANHPGLIDASLLSVSLPRPLRVLVDSGVMPGVWNALAGATGRIVTQGDDFERAALREAGEWLSAGEGVGVFPEGSLSDGGVHRTRAAAAYLQIRSNCPVVPVALFGTHGRRPTDPPKLRSTIDIVIGPVWQPPKVATPLSRAAVVSQAELLRQRLADHVVEAQSRAARAGVRLGSAQADNGDL